MILGTKGWIFIPLHEYSGDRTLFKLIQPEIWWLDGSLDDFSEDRHYKRHTDNYKACMKATYTITELISTGAGSNAGIRGVASSGQLEGFVLNLGETYHTNIIHDFIGFGGLFGTSIHAGGGLNVRTTSKGERKGLRTQDPIQIAYI